LDVVFHVFVGAAVLVDPGPSVKRKWSKENKYLVLQVIYQIQKKYNNEGMKPRKF
jgi:hypothetical protein